MAKVILLGMTRGRRSLLAVLQIARAADVAARVRVSAPLVSMWAAGVVTPGPQARARLEANYGISRGSWDVLLVVRNKRS